MKCDYGAHAFKLNTQTCGNTQPHNYHICDILEMHTCSCSHIYRKMTYTREMTKLRLQLPNTAQTTCKAVSTELISLQGI